MRKLWIAGATIGALLTIGGLRAGDLRGTRAEALTAAEARAANLSRIITAYLGETFAAGDASLRQLVLHGRRVGGSTAPDRDWAPSLASAKAGLTSLGAITVVDRDGLIRHSTRAAIVGESRRDEVIFRQAAAATTDDLLIGTPFPSRLGPRDLVIPIGRRLTRDDGTFDGGVFASFVPAATRGFFETVNVGRRGAVWVFHPTGVVLFRAPMGGEAIGDSARDNPVFVAASRGGASGTLRVAMNLPAEAGSHISRVMLSAFHTSAVPPIIAAVSLDQDEVLADWRREAVASTWIFAVAVVTLGATLLVLFRQMDAKAAAERALTDTQELEASRFREANDRLASALEREQAARRDAEAASALKDQFLMTVSHELRTPLTAIAGWSRMLVDGTVRERQQEPALRSIERNARAQMRLIDDLLDVAGAMGGKVRLDPRMVQVAEVVQDAVETVAPAAAAKSIRIETSVSPDAGRVQGDPDRLQQIAWNLLSNAVKFTPEGGTVRVEARRAGREVEIVVTDSGIGISPDFLPHVFDRFRQEDAGTRRRHGGLGLGLAIVRSLVELHGGSVSAHSEGHGHGSTFVVRLPAPLATEGTHEPETPARPLRPGAPIP